MVNITSMSNGVAQYLPIQLTMNNKEAVYIRIFVEVPQLFW